MLKVNNKNTRSTPRLRFGAFIVTFWTYFTRCSSVYIVNFEHILVALGVEATLCLRAGKKVEDEKTEDN